MVEPYEEENMITSAVWHEPQRVASSTTAQTAQNAPPVVVDDELEAATRFNGSEEDEYNEEEQEDEKSRINGINAEIWRKTAVEDDQLQEQQQNAVMLKDMAL